MDEATIATLLWLLCALFVMIGALLTDLRLMLVGLGLSCGVTGYMIMRGIVVFTVPWLTASRLFLAAGAILLIMFVWVLAINGSKLASAGKELVRPSRSDKDEGTPTYGRKKTSGRWSKTEASATSTGSSRETTAIPTSSGVSSSRPNGDGAVV